MSAKGNRHSKKPIDHKFFNTFSALTTSKKKMPLNRTPSSAKKLKTGLRKIRKTEDRLFWDGISSSGQDEPIEASSPVKKSEEESPLFKKKRRNSFNYVEVTELSAVQTSTVKEKNVVEMKARKIVRAKRHLRHDGVDKFVETSINNKYPGGGILKHKRHSKIDETGALVDVQLQKQDDEIAEQNGELKLPSSDSVSFESSTKNNEKALVIIKIDEADTIDLNSTYCRKPESVAFNNTTFTENEEVVTLKKSSGVIFIHDSKSIISPSTSSADMQADFSFNCSQEDLHPSTSGTIDTSKIKRRTFELEESVNDISLLKSTAESDSFRRSALQGEHQSSVDIKFQQVTTRRKYEKEINNCLSPVVRLSHFTPPWGSDDTTPTKTSTPMSLKKSQSLLIKTLSKDVNKSNCKIKGKSASKIKLPDFAAIHERALQKVESISEYKKRKEDRAKMLLSGNKPVEENKSKKQLRFATDTADREKSPGFIPLPSTPLPKFKHRPSIDALQMSDKKHTPLNPVARKLLRKTIDSPIVFTKQEKENKKPLRNNTLKIGTNPFGFNVGVSKIAKPVVIAKKKEIGVVRDKIPKPVNQQINSFSTRLPKPALPTKKDEFKAMVTGKAKQNTDSKNKKRADIKGVRSNRRFDLLMNMRKGK